MHDNIEQGLEIYRQEMAKYRKYFDKHGLKVGHQGILSKPVERELVFLNGRLQGMRDVGMTKEEELKIDRELGFEVNPAPSPERRR